MNRIIVKDNYIYNDYSLNKVILHLSDIHFNINTKVSLFDKILKRVYIEKPDYIMITGDLLDDPSIIYNKKKIVELVKFLSDLGELSIVLISIGNHDVFLEEDFRFFKKINDLRNIYVLNNNIYQDEYIYIYGNTLPSEYYYNVTDKESSSILLEVLKDNHKILSKMPRKLFKIGLFHSPICLMENDVFNKIKDFDLVLSGHMHDGMLPNIISKYSNTNKGIIGPGMKWFPLISRGRIDKEKTTFIITGGITKLSYKSGKILSNLNFLYNKNIDRIILMDKKGRYYYGKN